MADAHEQAERRDEIRLVPMSEHDEERLREFFVHLQNLLDSDG